MACDLRKEEKKIAIRIEKAARRLKCLEDIKDRIEKLMQRYLQETCEIEKRITQTEQLIECLMQAQRVAISQRKIREEILCLKDQKRVAEAFRRQKTLSSDCIAIVPDYTVFPLFSAEISDEKMPSFAFEIKPKCALDIDGGCRFCLKQKDKLQSGRIQRVTDYCPKDLFSRDIERTREAIICLIENPQNNFQIYKNSKLIFSNDNNQIDQLEDHFASWENEDFISTMTRLLAEILLFKYEYKIRCNKCKDLPKFTVLDRIFQLQELDSNNKPLTTKKGYVDLLLTKIKEDNLLCERCNITRHLEGPLIQHYISKIARDCSIMLTIKQIPNKYNERLKDLKLKIINIDGKDYAFDVKLFDLFPKSEK